jgi:hypothetical protein
MSKVTYRWEDNPHLFLPITVLGVLFVVFFLLAFSATLHLQLRIMREVDPKLPWAQRALLSTALMNSPDFASNRFWIGVGFVGCFLSMAAMVVISALFGNPA